MLSDRGLLLRPSVALSRGIIVSAQSRLNTRDRLRSWGMQVSGNCCLCGNATESHAHLFFSCPFVYAHLASLVKCSLVQGMHDDLSSVFNWFFSDAKGKGLRCICLRASLASAVYGLWRERNCRIFQGKMSSQDQMYLRIHSDVRAFLSSRRNLKASIANKDLCARWNGSDRILRFV